MKQLLLVLLLLHGLNKAYAQQYFNKRYPLHAYAANFCAVIPAYGKYYCVGLANDSSNSTIINSVKFTILDSMGNILKDTFYQRPGVREFYTQNKNSFVQTSDGGFLFGLAQDYDPNTGIMYALLIKYDSAGNMLWTREYNKPFCTDTTLYYSVADIKQTPTGEWLMLTTIQCPTDPVDPTFMVLTKLDSNFHELWSKKYGYPLKRNKGTRVVIENDGYTLGGGVTNNYYSVMTGIKWQALLIKTDTAGIERWRWESDSTRITYDILDVIRLTDGGYLYCTSGNGHEEDFAGGTASTLYYKGWVEKIDSNRNVIWNDTVSIAYSNNAIPALTSIKQLADGDIVIAGNVIGGFYPTDTPIVFNYTCLMKYSANGTVIWRRKYKVNEFTLNYTYDMKQTRDGGFVICGESDDNNRFYGNTAQQGLVLKVDSRGCQSLTDPQCAHDGIRAIAAAPFRVYPNPATTSITVDCPYTAAQEEIVITDVFGRPILTKKLLNMRESMDITTWPPGVYLYRVLSGGATVQTGRVVKY